VLKERGGKGYTTVLKLMQIMTQKGLVLRDESQKTHIYRACAAEERTQRQLIRDLVDRVFSGSAERLVMRALEEKKVSAEELGRIRKLLDEIEGDRS
jgi:predicted transcriptional regulator